MRILFFFIFIFLLLSSCAYNPACSQPSSGDLSNPIKILLRDDSLFVLNSDASSSFCSGYISQFSISSSLEKPSFVRNLFPLPEQGENPSLLADFDVSDNSIVVTDRYSGQVLLINPLTYNEDLCTAGNRNYCKTSVVDTLSTPLSSMILDDSHILITTTPLGSLILYTKGDNGTFSSSFTYSFPYDITQTTSPLLKRFGNEIYVTFTDYNTIYVFSWDGENIKLSKSITLSPLSSGSIYAAREIDKCDEEFVLVTRNQDFLVKTDSDLTPVNLTPSLLTPTSIACNGDYVVISDFDQDKIGIYESSSFTLLNVVDVCDGPLSLQINDDTTVLIACFYENLVEAISIPDGAVMWKLP